MVGYVMPVSIERLRHIVNSEEQKRSPKFKVTVLPTKHKHENVPTYLVMDTVNQDLLKVFLWRLISIPISMLTTYLFTGRADLSLSLTIVLTIVLTTGQFFYEKLWRYLINNHI